MSVTEHFYSGSSLPLGQWDVAEGILFSDGGLVWNTALELVRYKGGYMFC